MAKKFKPPRRMPKELLEALNLIRSNARKQFAPLDALERRHIQHVRKLFEDRNVVGIGISEKETEKKGTGALSLTFYVEKKQPKTKVKPHKMIPPIISVSGRSAVFTDVQEIGKLRLHVKSQQSPIESGYSIGGAEATGTLGAVVKRGSKYFLLSNSHVIAESGLAKIGDKVIYPGRDDLDGADPHVVGVLSQFVPFKTTALVNLVNAALAQVNPDAAANLDFSIEGAKTPLATIAPAIGMNIVMQGRTSGVSTGAVKCTTFTYSLDYPNVGTIGFTNQVLCTKYAEPGDSGALVVDEATGKIVGLHCGGAPNFSFFNPISAVVDALSFQFTRS